MEWIFLAVAVFLIFAAAGAIRENMNKRKISKAARLYARSVDEELQKLVKDNSRASLPALDANTYQYRPVGKEALLAIQDGAIRMELRSTGRYRTGGTSISIPIVKGVRYRVGSGSIRGEKEWQLTATGRLLITDKAISFEGGDKNERITWSQIANVEILLDGFRITKRTGPPRTYLVSSPNPKFTAVVELMLARAD